MTDFEQLYDTYFNDVYLYILRLSGNEHIAEEITSDTFFKAMKSINSFRGDSDVRVWLCQIAKNCYYSYIKRNNRTEQVDEAELQEIPDLASSVADEYARREEIEQIQRFCTMLASRTRKSLCGACMRSFRSSRLLRSSARPRIGLVSPIIEREK